jgi:hypothetical protein
VNDDDVRILGAIIDVDRYPLTDPGSTGWQAAVDQARADLAGVGCCVLTDFIRVDKRDQLRAECAAIAPRAYYDVETVNVYNIAVDDSLPADHPGRLQFQRGNAFVPRDRIGADLIIHRLYSSELFQRFLADCVAMPALYELADPLAALCLNVVAPGHEHPWHFDTNEFAVSMLTQLPGEGGVFEYVPNIRTEQAENFGDVRAVLAGTGGPAAHRLELRPGDLQLFRGRFSLHRVTRVGGSTPRHTAIFAYSERPGVIGSPARTRQLFGRVLPEHLAGERAVRGDQLLD